MHIFCSLKYFKNYVPIKPINIKLPNGHTTFATIKGTIQFSPKLYLIDVLYVPDFFLNLIYVPRLMIDLQASVLFDILKSLIQDMKTKEVIGSGMIFEGLCTWRSQRQVMMLLSTPLRENQELYPTLPYDILD